jgi:hypothetical protein
MVLSAAAHDPRASNLVEQLTDVVVAGPLDSLGVNPLDAARIIKTQAGLAVAADDDLR